MLNEEIDENEYYHQDFTTASDWEIFVSNLEEIINQWKVDDSRLESKNDHIWSTKSSKLMFVDTEFELFHYKLNIEDKEAENTNFVQIPASVNLNHDFLLQDSSLAHDHSNLYYWYGVKEYYVLTPSGHYGITSESKIKVLLSSICIAANNIAFELPIFIQIREKWQKLYLGVHENPQFRTNFQMVHLRRAPQSCGNLLGLIRIFQAKIMSPLDLDPVISSVQYRFDLSEFGKFYWKQDIFNKENDIFDLISINRLPFGVTIDPVGAIQLNATWFNVPSNRVNDSEIHSDFKAPYADQWSMLFKKNEEQGVRLLADCLNEYIHLNETSLTVYDILGERSPLEALIEGRAPGISSVFGRTSRASFSGRDVAPISEEILVPTLYYLFPDADKLNSNPYSAESGIQESLDKDWKGFKTCQPQSLLWRFAILSANCLHTCGGSRAFAQLWYEFVQEMRYRWENNILIPGLAHGFPDLRTCLLNQKLQMLNCCIERKKARDDKEPHFDSAENSSSTDDDEEFFDCADKPCEDTKPIGRLGRFQNLRLLETGENMYVPITQEPVPKTEDQLDEDADVLLKLGADAQGSELRAKLMSASLLSDMESFKAANPGCVLEDFVRWYSPRDWQETDELDKWGQKKGKLSNRMMIEDNIWAQMWKSAKPVPAAKQKLLFVDTREAEKVLHFLESRTLGQIAELFLPILLQAAICRLAEEATSSEVDSDKLQNVVKQAERITRENKIPLRRVEAIVQEIEQLELNLSEINSLNYKLNARSDLTEQQFDEIVRDLVKGKEIKIDMNSTIADRLNVLFRDAHRDSETAKEESEETTKKLTSVFSSPNEREYVMRVNAFKPAVHSALCPQYLRVLLGRNEFRLSGAFAEDICFF